MSDIVNIKSNGKMLEFWLDELSNYSELRSSLIVLRKVLLRGPKKRVKKYPAHGL